MRGGGRLRAPLRARAPASARAKQTSEAGPFDLDTEVVAVVTSAVEGSEDAQTRLAGGAGTIKYISDVKSEDRPPRAEVGAEGGEG